jgi:hypothetical protein
MFFVGTDLRRRTQTNSPAIRGTIHGHALRAEKVRISQYGLCLTHNYAYSLYG